MSGSEGLIDLYTYNLDLYRSEGNSGARTFTFYVNRTGSDSEAVAVNWQLKPGDSVFANDFIGGIIPSGTVNFTAGGSNSIAVSFQVAGDTVAERNETFQLQITGIVDAPGGVTYSIGNDSISGLIFDEDAVSRVYTDTSLATFVSGQRTRTEFVAALRSLGPNQAIEVVKPSDIGNLTGVTINTDNVTVIAAWPFKAQLTLGGTVAAFKLSGTSDIDVTGNASANTIIGSNGINRLDGRGGVDTLNGRGGNDTYVVDNIHDVVVEAAGGGSDTVNAVNNVSYTLGAGVQVELLATGDASATGAINLTGNEFMQTLYGNNGINHLDGKGGADTMRGFAGGDTYVVDNPGDVVVEIAGGGADIVQAAISYALGGGAEIETVETTVAGGTAVINLTGNQFAQTLNGNAGINRLDGNGGADTMNGRGGNDVYIVDNPNDVVIEVGGGGTSDAVYVMNTSYALTASAQIELLASFNDSATVAMNLYGNNYAQTITGNNGPNQISGGLNTDTLRGLGGQDLFLFNTPLAVTNADTIVDFVAVDDTIRLDDAIFTNLIVGNLPSYEFKDTAYGPVVSENRIIYNSATGDLYFDRDGSDNIYEATKFANLSGHPAISAADFFVI